MTHSPTKRIRPQPHIPPSRTWGWIYVIIGSIPILFNLLPVLGSIVYSLFALITMLPEDAISAILTFLLFAISSVVMFLPSGIFGGVFIFLGLRHFQRDKALKTTAQLTQATITDRWTRYYKGRRYYIAYEYCAYSPEGSLTRYQAAERHYKDIPYQTGDTAPLHYLPNDPKVCRLEVEDMSAK